MAKRLLCFTASSASLTHEKSQSLHPREAPYFSHEARHNKRVFRQMLFYPPTVSQYANLAASSTTQQPQEV